MPRKRAVEEVEAEPVEEAPVSPLTQRIRNTWQFANLMQFIYLFGHLFKIGNEVDVDMLEAECCREEPTGLLSQIGLALLKFVSSHRGLTPEIFDEYTRRQYVAKAPDRNPFGEDEEPRKFADFDVFQKLRVLHQLSAWTLANPNRIREAMGDVDPADWRVVEFGWDEQDRTYYILDDNRLYRMTQPPPPEAPKKAKAKSKSKSSRKSKGSRASKRQKLSNGDVAEPEGEHEAAEGEEKSEDQEDDGLGGVKWECVAVTLKEYTDFMESIKKTKDPDQKEMYNRLQQEVMPEIERQAEVKARKLAAQRREMENINRLANAKRSGRLAEKQERERQQKEEEEAERKKADELAMAHKEQERQRKMEESRESRIMTREQRLKDREMKRILNEQELARLEAQGQEGSESGERVSERQRQSEVEKKRKELEEWNVGSEDWYFDCSICSAHGQNFDDGTHSLACEKCNVWQHSACHGISPEQAEKEDFHFLCASCSKPKPLKLNINGKSSSPPAVGTATDTTPPSSKRKRARPRVEENGSSASKKARIESTEGKSEVKPVAKDVNGTAPKQNPYHVHARAWELEYPSAMAQSDNQAHTGGYSSHVSKPSSSNTSVKNTNTNSSFTYYNPYSAQFNHHTPSAATFPPANTAMASNSSYQQQTANNQPPTALWSTSTHGQSNLFRNQNQVHQSHNSVSPSAATKSQTPNVKKFNTFASTAPHTTGQSLNGSTAQTPQAPARQMNESNGFNHGSTPTSSHSQSRLPPLGSSPQPALNATQGSTDVRFSPSSGFHNHRNQVTNASGYNTITNIPSGAAISPVKQSSSPPHGTGSFTGSFETNAPSSNSNSIPTSGGITNNSTNMTTPTMNTSMNGPLTNSETKINGEATKLSPTIGTNNVGGKVEAPIKKGNPAPAGLPEVSYGSFGGGDIDGDGKNGDV